MMRRRRRRRRRRKKKKTSDRKSVTFPYYHPYWTFSRLFFSICTLSGLLEARDTRSCILMTYVPIDKRVSYWSRAYLQDKIEKIWLSNHTMILDASSRNSHLECDIKGFRVVCMHIGYSGPP
jgi:hypothetical protein